MGKWDREGWIDKRGGGGSISLTVVCEELCVTKLCVTKMVGDKVLCVCVCDKLGKAWTFNKKLSAALSCRTTSAKVTGMVPLN